MKLLAEISPSDIEKISPSELYELYNTLNREDTIEFLKKLEYDIKLFKDDLDFLDSRNEVKMSNQKDRGKEHDEIFYKGNIVVWLFGNEYSVYEVVKAYEELYIISDLMGRQMEIDPRVVRNGGYKEAKDDLFLWYFEILEKNEIKIYPKKMTYNQMMEECRRYDIHLIKPLYSLGYTYNCNREDFKG